MFTLQIENQNGELIRLTQNESAYQIVNVDGLNPPKASIYTSAVAYMDGQRFRKSKLDMRNIVITVRINGDVETNRLILYRFVGTGKKCKVLYKNGSREVYIEGYVENVEVPLFTNSEQMQISIVCPDPYFRQLKAIHTDMSSVLAVFEFIHPDSKATEFPEEGVAFSVYSSSHKSNIVNFGETTTGLTMEVKASGTVVNPQIYNDDTKKYMKFNVTMLEGELLKVCTVRGHKSAVLIRKNGSVENVISKLDVASTWLELPVGENVFGYSAESGTDFMFITIEHETLYEGV